MFTFLRKKVNDNGGEQRRPWVIVGLGNPGAAYDGTRHNVGAALVRQLQRTWRYGDFVLDTRARALVSRPGPVPRRRAPRPSFLVIPTTFMNDSGAAVSGVLRKLQSTPDRLLVLHDDKDLPLGELRLHVARGSAGHKGVQSILDTLGTNAFWRLRVGIGPVSGVLSTDDFVLGAFSDHERRTLTGEIFPRAGDILARHITEHPRE